MKVDTRIPNVAFLGDRGTRAFGAVGARLCRTVFVLSIATLAAAGISSVHAQANPTAVSLTLTHATTAYSENFNSLASSGTANTTVPAGWGFVEDGGNTTYAAGTGSDNAGNTYSFGTTAADRALGGVQSGSVTPTIGAKFTNNTGLTLVDVAIAYRGEQWRLGTTGSADQLDFQYSATATAINIGTYTDFNALDFVAPVTTGTARAIDGNATGNFTAKSATVTGLGVANTASFFIRFNDFNATSADSGLAVDDFTLQVTKLGTNGNASVTSLSGPSTLIVQNGLGTAGVLTVTTAAAQTFAGTLVNGGTGTLGLTKSGASSLTLSGANTYTGGTTVGGGTLALSGAGTLGSGKLQVDTGATLDISSRTQDYSFASGVEGGGTLKTGATRTLTLTSTVNPGTSTTVGSLTVDGKVTLSSTATATFNIAANGASFDTINVATGGTFTQRGALSINLAAGWDLETNLGTIDFVTGAGSLAGNYTSVTFTGKYANSFISSGGLWRATTTDGGIFAYDPALGTFTAVPEPHEYGIAFAGLFGALIVIRRRRMAGTA